MKDEKPLKASALVRKLTNALENNIDNLFPNGVVTTCIVIGSILLASDQLLRVEELAIGACTHLIYRGKKKHKPGIKGIFLT